MKMAPASATTVSKEVVISREVMACQGQNALVRTTNARRRLTGKVSRDCDCSVLGDCEGTWAGVAHDGRGSSVGVVGNGQSLTEVIVDFDGQKRGVQRAGMVGATGSFGRLGKVKRASNGSGVREDWKAWRRTRRTTRRVRTNS